MVRLEMVTTFIKIIFFFIVGVAAASCWQTDGKLEKEFKKVNPGLEYKLIRVGYGDTVRPGEYLKLHIKQYYNDSLLSDTDSTMAQYQVLDSAALSKEAYSIFSKVRIADSLVFKVPVDSAFKTKRPAFVKKGGWLLTYVKVKSILRSDVEVNADIAASKRGG